MLEKHLEADTNPRGGRKSFYSSPTGQAVGLVVVVAHTCLLKASVVLTAVYMDFVYPSMRTQGHNRGGERNV
jgi:hypothetical protein